MQLPQRNPDVVYKEVADGAVLLSSVEEIYYGLNPIGAWIWEHLPPVSKTYDELCQTLHTLHPDVSVDEIRADVASLLTDLEREGLVTGPKAVSQDPANPTITQ